MSNIKYGHLPVHYPEQVFLIGDVHNEADKLMALLDQIEPLIGPNDHLVFLGDLVDRGNQPALTIEVLIDLAKKYQDRIYFVEGNHCWMLRNYLLTGSQTWMQYLSVTLEGFKTAWNLPDIMPATIAEALTQKGFREITSRMVPYYETDDLIGTHAPLDYNLVYMYGGDNYEEAYNDRANDPAFTHLLDRMKFEIKWQFSDEDTKIDSIDKFRVCGHQPTRTHPRIFKDRAFIDTGCGKGPKPLTCLVFPSKKYYQAK